jgi:hypothetical protein
VLTTVMQLPSTALSLARRTTSTSLVLLGELSATAFPTMAGPADRVAWRAWATGHYAGEPAQPQAGPDRRTLTSLSS